MMTYSEIIEQYEKKFYELQKAYDEKIKMLESRCEQYSVAYDSLKNQLQELLRHRFGRKSERYIDPDQLQFDLFSSNVFPSTSDDNNTATKNEINVPAHTRKKKKNNHLDLPRRIEIIPLTKEQKHCHCGTCKTVIRYETKELLHYQPAVFEVIEQRREVGACPNGCDNALVTAPAPLQILPKVKVTPEFLSFLAVSKLDDRQPLYHLEKQLNKRYGVDCSRQSMARWMIELCRPLIPMLNLFKDQAIEYDVASCDPTTLQVMNEPNRKNETKSYVYCIRGGPPGREVILYVYNALEHKQFIKNWLAGFQGYLHVDAQNVFELAGQIITLVICNAHARRKFEPIATQTKGKGIAKKALLFYKALYKIERDAKNNQLTPAERYTLRQKESKPVLDEFKSWLDSIAPTVLPQSPLGNAVQYCLNHWTGLIRFLDDGRLEIDNNLTEQEIKPLVIARKNFLFAGSVDGANALCVHLSLIRTAKAHGLDPYHYYVHLLKSIPHCQSLEDYEKLLPWQCKNSLAN